MALIRVGDGGGEGDLLAAVGSEDVEVVVVDADAVVRVVGCESDLHGERDGVGDGRGEVEGVESGGLCRNVEAETDNGGAMWVGVCDC